MTKLTENYRLVEEKVSRRKRTTTDLAINLNNEIEHTKGMTRPEKRVYFQNKQKSTELAVILSILMPGLGQYYYGNHSLASFMLLSLIFSFISIILLIGFILVPLVYLFGIIDAYRGVCNYNNELFKMLFRHD